MDRGGIADDERNEDGEDMYARSRVDPADRTRQWMEMGYRTIKTLYSIAKETPEQIVKKMVILKQLHVWQGPMEVRHTSLRRPSDVCPTSVGRPSDV